MFAIILAAGEGTRLRPLTDSVPKPLIPVVGRPIIEHQLLQLREAGVSDVIVTQFYLSHVFQDQLGDKKFGIKIHHLIDREAGIGTAGGLKDALRLVPEAQENVFVLYADIISNLDFQELLESHRRSSCEVTCLFVPQKLELGVLLRDESGNERFVEKPVLQANGSVYVFNRRAFPRVPERGDLVRDVLVKLPPESLHRFFFEGFWQNIEREGDIVSAETAAELWVHPPEGGRIRGERTT